MTRISEHILNFDCAVMGLSPFTPGLWLNYVLSSQNPSGVNQCVLEEPQLLLRQALHQLSSRLWEGGPWTLSTATYEKMFFSLRPYLLVIHLHYEQAFSMSMFLRTPLKPIHSHQLHLYSWTTRQNTITSLLSAPLILWTFSHSCIVSDVKIFWEWPWAHIGVTAFLAKTLDPCTVHLQATQ